MESVNKIMSLIGYHTSQAHFYIPYFSVNSKDKLKSGNDGLMRLKKMGRLRFFWTKWRAEFVPGTIGWCLLYVVIKAYFQISL